MYGSSGEGNNYSVSYSSVSGYKKKEEVQSGMLECLLCFNILSTIFSSILLLFNLERGKRRNIGDKGRR